MMHPKTTHKRNDILEIHVLGAGKGESIVIGWPENRWGVVDCYSPSLKNPSLNPTLQFLREKGVNELEFLCLTHPHDDHFRGMSHLLDHLRVNHFWRFSTLSGRDLRNIVRCMEIEANLSATDDLLESVNDLSYTLTRVNTLREEKRIKQQMVVGKQALYPIPHDNAATFQVWSFAPTGDQAASYEQKMLQCFDENGFFRRDCSVPHNEISVGLVLHFGTTRVLLCGDLERNAWKAVLDQNSEELLAAQVIKVAHHGSQSGLIDGLWERMSRHEPPLAIIAPYRRFKLPETVATENILNHVSALMLTCDTDPKSLRLGEGNERESREFLKNKHRTNDGSSTQVCGRCSVHLDTEGRILFHDCVGPAWLIPGRRENRFELNKHEIPRE